MLQGSRSILQYFPPSLSYHLSLCSLFCLFFEWPLKTGFTVPFISTSLPYHLRQTDRRKKGYKRQTCTMGSYTKIGRQRCVRICSVVLAVLVFHTSLRVFFFAFFLQFWEGAQGPFRLGKLARQTPKIEKFLKVHNYVIINQ